jgi:hypothetical protein
MTKDKHETAHAHMTTKQLNAVNAAIRQLIRLKEGSATKVRRRPRNRVAVHRRWKAGTK